jgi:5-formyltetrahydrofolate cyclo-ligase
MAGEPQMSKVELRGEMRRLRAAIPPEERARGAGRIEDRVMALDEVRAARAVLLFYAFGSEVATRAISERLHAEGKRLLLPFLGLEGMEAAEVRPGAPLVSTAYGPREPPHRVALDPAAVDVVITPGLAFDRRGYRLGYGGGHYDRYLSRLRPEASSVGLAFSIQVIDRIPEDPFDQRVHLIVTDVEVIDCRPL